MVLGRPAGFVSAAVFGVSDDTRAAGAAANASGSHAVLWLNDAGRTPVDLGTLAGDPEASALAVNDTGQVVGVSTGPLSPLGAAERGFLYQNDVMRELTALLDPADGTWAVSRAVGINNAGHIIGMGTQGGAHDHAGADGCDVSSSRSRCRRGSDLRAVLLANPPPWRPCAYSPGGPPADSLHGRTIAGTPRQQATHFLRCPPAAGGRAAPACQATRAIVLRGSYRLATPHARSRRRSSIARCRHAVGACGVAADVVSMSGAGSCAVTAAQAGDANYEAAMPVTQSFTIARGTPVITWAAPADITFGTPLSATQLNATANVAGAFVYVPPIGTLLPLGTATLTALFTPADAANYTTATAHVSINVVSAAPSDANRIVQPPDQINSVGDRVEAWIFVTGDLARGSFAAANLPAGLAIDRHNGLISGRIKRGAQGNYTVTVRFTQRGVTYSRTFTWTVR